MPNATPTNIHSARPSAKTGLFPGRYGAVGWREQGGMTMTTVRLEWLWVRTTNNGDQARFATSTDGNAFKDFGPMFTIRFGKWTGDRLGLFCWNEKEEAGHIDVDCFHYDYDGPRKLSN